MLGFGASWLTVVGCRRRQDENLGRCQQTSICKRRARLVEASSSVRSTGLPEVGVRSTGLPEVGVRKQRLPAARGPAQPRKARSSQVISAGWSDESTAPELEGSSACPQRAVAFVSGHSQRALLLRSSSQKIGPRESQPRCPRLRPTTFHPRGASATQRQIQRGPAPAPNGKAGRSAAGSQSSAARRAGCTAPGTDSVPTDVRR